VLFSVPLPEEVEELPVVPSLPCVPPVPLLSEPLPEVDPLPGEPDVPVTDPLPLVEFPPAPEADGWFVLIEPLLLELDGLV